MGMGEANEHLPSYSKIANDVLLKETENEIESLSRERKGFFYMTCFLNAFDFFKYCTFTITYQAFLQ
jgi:hypothetical protein